MLTRDPEKLKVWRERSKGLARTGGPKRRTKIKATNSKRRAAKWEKNYGARRAWIVSLGCFIAGHPLHRCKGSLESAHVIARGAGGAKGNRRHQVCQCSAAAKEAGEHPGIGRWEGTQRAVFQAKYTVDLVATAAELAERADALGYP
jgi:hypothetical protein